MTLNRLEQETIRRIVRRLRLLAAERDTDAQLHALMGVAAKEQEHRRECAALRSEAAFLAQRFLPQTPHQAGAPLLSVPRHANGAADG